jgi:hypothetical protein
MARPGGVVSYYEQLAKQNPAAKIRYDQKLDELGE